jgi:triosephosphate isomerase
MEKLLILNLKAHEQGIGRRARYIGDIVNRLSNDSGVRIVLAAQPTDIENLSYKNEVFAQHIDPIPYGSSTGYILPEAVRGAGATGTLINHSERMLSMDEIRQRIERAKNVGLSTVVFASSAEQAEQIAGMSPNYITVEHPESGEVSLSKANPVLINETVSRVRAANPAVRILAGEGINSGQDVMAALALGTTGVLISSAVLKSNNPEDVLRDILGGF